MGLLRKMQNLPGGGRGDIYQLQGRPDDGVACLMQSGVITYRDVTTGQTDWRRRTSASETSNREKYSNPLSSTQRQTSTAKWSAIFGRRSLDHMPAHKDSLSIPPLAKHSRGWEPGGP